MRDYRIVKESRRILKFFAFFWIKVHHNVNFDNLYLVGINLSFLSYFSVSIKNTVRSIAIDYLVKKTDKHKNRGRIQIVYITN